MLLASESWTAVGIIIAIVGVFVAMLALIITSQQHRKALWAGIVMSRIDQYGQPEMLNDILRLHRFKRETGSDFAEVFIDRKERQQQNPSEDNKDEGIEKIDNARRRVKHYFLSIGYLVHKRVIKPKDVRTIHTKVALDTLLYVIEPMERASEKKTGRVYEKEVFDIFQEIRRQWAT